MDADAVGGLPRRGGPDRARCARAAWGRPAGAAESRLPEELPTGARRGGTRRGGLMSRLRLDATPRSTGASGARPAHPSLPSRRPPSTTIGAPGAAEGGWDTPTHSHPRSREESAAAATCYSFFAAPLGELRLPRLRPEGLGPEMATATRSLRERRLSSSSLVLP